MLNQLKRELDTVIIFSGKKVYTVDRARNSRNDRYLTSCIEEVPPVLQTKHPASARVLRVVASDGKRMPPHRFAKGTRVDTEEYLRVLREVLKPWPWMPITPLATTSFSRIPHPATRPKGRRSGWKTTSRISSLGASGHHHRQISILSTIAYEA